MEAERMSFVKEIEGYLNNKRCLYEVEGRREYLPLVDQALNLIRNMRNVATTESSNQQSNNLTFDRPSEKMYHYAEGEAIDCAICIEHVEANHAQVRLSCGHIYHLNCLGSHFNHSGDYKCPYCRVEVDKYVKQPRIWEHPVNAPPQTPNQIDANDIPHPGELDFANFQRGVLQVVNSLFGGRLNLGHPFRNDNGTEEDYYDNEEDSPSENDDTIYDTRYLGSNDSESSDDSDESEDDREYDHDSNIGFRSQRNSYYSSSNEALASTRRTNSRLGMDSTLRTRSISRNRPRPDSMSGSAFRSRPNRPSSFAPDTTPRSEVNEMSRHASTSSRLRNMYQDDSTTDDLMDGESGSSHSSTEDSDDEDEVMFTDASNDMDTSDEDSGSENEGYRSRSYSHRSSLSSISPVSSSDEEEHENDNESVVTTSTNNSNQQWYKLPWSWSLNTTTTTSASTIAASDTDATISSGDDFE